MGGAQGTRIRHALALLATLAVLWVLLSGMFEPLQLGLGVLSCVLVVALALRMELTAGQLAPMRLHPLRLLRYWTWLSAQIVRANVQVARCILDPRLPISPCLVRVCSTQRGSVARTILANSITLTPGTVSIDVTEGEIEVHALTRVAAAQLAACDMDRRVSALERDA